MLKYLTVFLVLAVIGIEPGFADEPNLPKEFEKTPIPAAIPVPRTPTPHKIHLPYFRSQTSPVSVESWATYTDEKFGFSIQYPVIPGVQPLEPYPNACFETEIHFPSVYDPGVVAVLTFTDQSVPKWNENVEKDGGEADADYFPYSPRIMRADLSLPAGAKCKFNPNGIVTELNGVKALRGPNWGGDGTAYYVSRGKNLWLEIDLLSFDGPFLPSDPNHDLTPELRDKKKAALQAVLDTLKFFKPKKVKTQK